MIVCEHGNPLKDITTCAECMKLLAASADWDEHPEGYDGPCMCHACASYGDPTDVE